LPVDLVKTRPLPASPFYLVQATGNPEVEVSRRSRRTLRQNTGGFPHNWRKQAWLLKNSVAEIAQKIRCARMPYKPFSPPGHTSLVTHFEPIFRKNGLFQHPQALTQVIVQNGTSGPEHLCNGDVTPAIRRWLVLSFLRCASALGKLRLHRLSQALEAAAEFRRIRPKRREWRQHHIQRAKQAYVRCQPASARPDVV
jgi:hypothetical protein